MHAYRCCKPQHGLCCTKLVIRVNTQLVAASDWSIDDGDRQEVALYRGGLTVAGVGELSRCVRPTAALAAQPDVVAMH